MKYTYRPKGTCSSQIELELDGNIVHNVKLPILLNNVRMTAADSGIACDAVIHIASLLANAEHGLLKHYLFLTAAPKQIRPERLLHLSHHHSILAIESLSHQNRVSKVLAAGCLLKSLPSMLRLFLRHRLLPKPGSMPVL